MAEIIDNTFLADQKRGLLLSFANAAAELRSKKCRDMYRDSSQKFSFVREKIARPLDLGFFNTAIPDGPDIISNGITVKPAGSLNMGLPECFAFMLPMARIVGADVLQLRGPKSFREADIILIVQRTDIEKNQAHRPQFSGWHTHLDRGRDFAYNFCSSIPTEFKEGNIIVPGRPNYLTRMGAECLHRSPKNKGDDSRRLWASFVVADPSRVSSLELRDSAYRPWGPGMITGARQAALDSAAEYLANHNNFEVIDPEPLFKSNQPELAY